MGRHRHGVRNVKKATYHAIFVNINFLFLLFMNVYGCFVVDVFSGFQMPSSQFTCIKCMTIYRYLTGRWLIFFYYAIFFSLWKLKLSMLNKLYKFVGVVVKILFNTEQIFSWDALKCVFTVLLVVLFFFCFFLQRQWQRMC